MLLVFLPFLSILILGRFIVYALNMCIKGTGRAKMPLQVFFPVLLCDSPRSMASILIPLFLILSLTMARILSIILSFKTTSISYPKLNCSNLISSKSKTLNNSKETKIFALNIFDPYSISNYSFFIPRNIDDRYQYLLYFINNMIFSYAKQNSISFLFSTYSRLYIHCQWQNSE